MNPDNLIKVNRLRRKELDNELSRIYVWRSLKEAQTKKATCSHKNKRRFSVFSFVIGIAREIIRQNFIDADCYDKKLRVI